MNNLHFPSNGQKPIDLPFLNAPSKSLQMIINGNQPQFFGSYQPGAGTYTPANPLGGLPVMGQPAQQSSASSRINEILRAMQAGAGATKTPQMSVQQLNQRDQYQADLRTAASFAPRMDQSGTLRDRGGFLATSDYVGPSAEEIAQMRRFGIGLPALRNSLGMVKRAEAAGVAGYDEFMEFKRNEGYGPVLQKHFSDMQSRARAATEERIAATGSMMPAGPSKEQQFDDYISKLASQGWSVLTAYDTYDAETGQPNTSRGRLNTEIADRESILANMAKNLDIYNRTPGKMDEIPWAVRQAISSGRYQKEQKGIESDVSRLKERLSKERPEIYVGGRRRMNVRYTP